LWLKTKQPKILHVSVISLHSALLGGWVGKHTGQFSIFFSSEAHAAWGWQ